MAGLAHGNRGRPAHNVVQSAITERVVELAGGKHASFNQQHLTEMLAENEGVLLSRPTVRRLSREAGIASPRRRRPPRHRRRRDRLPQQGMLAQLEPP